MLKARMKPPRALPVLGATVFAFLLTAGCGGDGPEVIPVEGIVTLDGRPLEGAIVTFTPKASGRPSSGSTDAEGWYELTYSRDQNGALPGEHIVRISTYQEGNPGEGQSRVPEKLPAKYNTKTELTKTVGPDDSVIDFELVSEGDIVEPTADQ